MCHIVRVNDVLDNDCIRIVSRKLECLNREFLYVCIYIFIYIIKTHVYEMKYETNLSFVIR